MWKKPSVSFWGAGVILAGSRKWRCLVLGWHLTDLASGPGSMAPWWVILRSFPTSEQQVPHL